jgi:hypothetical protein
MNISWVVSDSAVLDPVQELEPLKQIGSFWGSWRTWRAWQTDNVICHDQARADELLKRAFQAACNFYIPNSAYVALNRPLGVQVYQGDFVHDLDRKEEIVAMHLAASTSDIVLLVGFDFAQQPKNSDRSQDHQAQHHCGLALQVIRDNADTQWVLIDHPGKPHPGTANLPNLTQDTMSGVLELLNS